MSDFLLQVHNYVGNYKATLNCDNNYSKVFEEVNVVGSVLSDEFALFFESFTSIKASVLDDCSASFVTEEVKFDNDDVLKIVGGTGVMKGDNVNITFQLEDGSAQGSSCTCLLEKR